MLLSHTVHTGISQGGSIIISLGHPFLQPPSSIYSFDHSTNIARYPSGCVARSRGCSSELRHGLTLRNLLSLREAGILQIGIQPDGAGRVRKEKDTKVCLQGPELFTEVGRWGERTGSANSRQTDQPVHRPRGSQGMSEA